MALAVHIIHGRGPSNKMRLQLQPKKTERQENRVWYIEQQRLVQVKMTLTWVLINKDSCTNQSVHIITPVAISQRFQQALQ